MQRRRLIQVAAAGGAAMLGVARAQGSHASDKVVRWVLGFAPGGGTDALARALAPRVGAQLGVTVIVENKPGANGNLAAETVARAEPDGLTYLYNTSSLVTSPFLFGKLSWDPFRDFAAVAPIANVPLLLVAHPSLPPTSLQEFIRYAKEQGGKLTYASAGNGNVTHLSNLLFQHAVGITATHVPYKGGGPALNDLLGGHVNFYMDTANTAIPFAQKKLVKAYASTGLRRLAALPEIPTVAETASPGFDTGSWSGLVAPGKTPTEWIQRMNAAVRSVQQESEAVAVFAKNEAEIRSTAADQYAAFLRSESERWGAVIRKNNVRLD